MGYKAKKIPRGLRNSVWSVIDAALYPALYLATLPLLLRSFGPVAFGAWIVLNSLITILQLLNFNLGIANIGVATIRSVASANANNDDSQVKNTINSILHFTIILVAVVVLIGLALAYGAGRYGWWGLRNATNINIPLCVLLSAIIAGLKFFDQVFQSVIKAYEHFKLASILNMANRIGTLTVTLVLAVKGFPISQILLANIIFLILYLIVQFICVSRVVPSYKFGRVRDNTVYRRLLSSSVFPWIQSLIIAFTFQSDRFWVSSYSGLNEVSGYGLAATMFNHIHMIFTAMAVWMLPRIAAMTSRGEDPAKLYQLVRGCLFGIVVASLLLFFFVSPYLIGVWVGPEVGDRLSTYIKSFVAFEIVFAHTIMPFLYLNAVGQERIATKATLLYCGVSYTFMLAGLFLFHSPLAMVGGMTIAMCLTMPIINAIVQKAMHHAYSPRLSVMEMLPMYLAIALVYGQLNTWVYPAVLAAVIVLLWKFYLQGIFNKSLWQQTSNT